MTISRPMLNTMLAALLALAVPAAVAADGALLSETFDAPASVGFFRVEDPGIERDHDVGALRIGQARFGDSPRAGQLRTPLVDLRKHRGETLRFAVRARLEPTDPVLSYVDTWVRIENAAGQPLLAKLWRVEHNGVFTGRQWATLELVVRVPQTAARAWLSVDVGLGTTWLDDVVVERVAERPGKPLSRTAREYLDAALITLQGNFVDSDDVAWSQLREQAYAQAEGALWPQDTYDAITLVVNQLPGRHTRFLSPQMTKGMQKGTRNAPSVAVTALDDVTRVAVPAYEGFEDRAAATRFAQESLAALAARAGATRGWIVDLRANGGGNMWPMLAAIEPLLGTDRPGAFVAGDTNVPWVVSAHIDKAPDAPTFAIPPSAPVAVLLGANTASSGEAVAIALRGRPNTRFFGAPSAGFATANAPFPLVDGALLLVTTSRMADRTGRVYENRVEPDETVDCGPADADACIARALAWLRSPAPAR